MQGKNEYVKLWVSYREYFKNLNDEEIGRLIVAMLDYRETGQERELTGNERFIWPAVKRDIDESLKTLKQLSRRNSDNARKRWEQSESNAVATQCETMRTDATQCETMRTDATQCETMRTDAKNAKVKEKGKGKGNNIPPIPPTGGFEEFWKLYPKKVGKKAAEKAFRRVKEPLETLLNAIERQKCSNQWSRDNGQYIPNPATWLNQGRWEDDLGGSSSGEAAQDNFEMLPDEPVNYDPDTMNFLDLIE